MVDANIDVVYAPQNVPGTFIKQKYVDQGDGTWAPQVVALGKAGSPLPTKGAGGTLTQVNTADPAAGNEWSMQVPAGTYRRILAIEVSLTTSAVVGNRACALGIANPSNVDLLRIALPNFFVTASSTVTHLYVVEGGGRSTQTFGGIGLTTLPDLVLPPQYILKSRTVALDAGDNYGAASILAIDYAASPY